VLLISKFDIRVVDVEVTCQSMGQTFNLDFDCPVRQTITQVSREDKQAPTVRLLMDFTVARWIAFGMCPRGSSALLS
jgi:hypothetical protein